MIENGLIFLLGGLTTLLILILLRRRSGSSSGDKKTKRDFFQNSNRTSRPLSVSADDRRRMEEEQNISAASLQILYDLNKSLSSTLDTYNIIDQALSSAISILGGEKADYYRVIPDIQELNLVRSIGRDSSEINTINQLLSRGEIKKDLKWIQKYKKRFLIQDTGENSLGGKGSVIDEGISSILSVPVLIDQELAGIISLLHTDENAYSLEQEELLTAIAHQAGLAINNSQRFVEVAFLLNSLKAKQELQDKLFEHLPVGVLLLDNQFQILSGNQLGYEIVNALHPDFDQIVVSRLGNKTIQELADLSMEPLPVEVQKEEGRLEIFEVQLRRAQTIEGGYWILMIANVTEEREIKNRVQVQERLATLGQFAAGITHDFNNILSAILVYSDVILRDSQLSEENRSRMNAIREQSQQATDLINRILDFSRDQPAEYKPFDLIPFLEQTRDLLIRIIPEDIQIQLDRNFSPETLPMRGDPARLQQMILNLALNARDAMPEGGILEIQVEIIEDTGESSAIFPGMEPGNWILFQVKDNGIGIDPQDQSRIFEPYFTTKAAQGGTGLGLAQVYGIVK
ncbi:MAG: ATP-binding protein, partial [Anaerolineales bacterium]